MVIKPQTHHILLKVGCDEAGIAEAAKIIREGGIAVFPTDTVYGIGCDPYNAEAAKRVYRIKSRDMSKPFPVLVQSTDVARQIAEFDDMSERLAEKFWPGQLTILLKLKDQNLKEPLGLADRIALRVPDSDCMLRLLERCRCVIGTSANVSGQPAFADPEKGIGSVDGYDVFVDGGRIESAGESTIVEVADGRINIVREGHLSAEVLRA